MCQIKAPVLVSFVIATFNCGSRTKELISTVRNFAGLSCEFIVADGGSTDETLSLIKTEPLLKLAYSSEDEGIYDAWNKALNCCKGLYISFIGVDDIPNIDFFNAVNNVIATKNIVPYFIYGDCIMKHGNYIRRLDGPGCNPNLFYASKPSFDVPHPGSFNHRNLFEKNKFSATYKIAGDLEFYLRSRELIKQNSCLYIPIHQAIIDADGISHSIKGASLYLREFVLIENSTGYKLNYSSFKLKLIILMGLFPKLFDFFRWLSWKIKHDSELLL